MSVPLSLQVPPFDVFDRKGPHPHETPSRDLGIYPFHLLFQVLQIQWDKLTWLFWIPSCLKVVHVLSITHLSEKSNPRARWKVSLCQCTWNRKWNYVNLCSKWIDVDGTGSFCNSTFWSVEAIWCWTTTSCRRDQRSKFQVSHASC